MHENRDRMEKTLIGKGRTMRRPGILFVLIVMAGCVGVVGATIVDISVATDKAIYQLNEHVTVFVTAYNPNQDPVTLGFGSSLTTTYVMDGVFNWSEGKVFNPSGRQLTIEANESFTWDITHGSEEMGLYALDLGVHSVVGEVVGYGQSDAVEFDVIPEPATILILSCGVFWARNKHRMPK